MTEEQVTALDDKDREHESKLRKNGWWATKAFQPAVRMHGATLPPADHPAAPEMYNKYRRDPETEPPAYTFLQGRQKAEEIKSNDQFWFWKQDLQPFVFQSNGGNDAGGGCFALYGLAREAALLHVRALVVVHFFSGYRRQGDLHSVVEHLTLTNGTHVFALSVDLCMQRRTGDLAKPGATRWWQERIRSGQIVAAGGGPPCET